MSEKKKVGRPKIDKPKSRLFTVRMEEEMYAQLNSKTMHRIFEYSNCDSLSQFIRLLLKHELRNAGLR